MKKAFSQLDLNLLRALDVLLDECNVSRASARLCVSQSAMSGMLARLRESFDEPLFIRTQYGIEPTERAKALHKPLKQVLADIQTLWQPPEFDPQTAEAVFKIGATDYALYSVVLPFLQQIQTRAPRIQVALLPIQQGNPSEKLAKGELDVALLTAGETHDNLYAKPLYDEEYVCVMRAQHPLAQRVQHSPNGLTLEDFCAAQHILVSYSGGQFSGLVDTALAKFGRSRRVMISVSHFLILPEILLQNDYIATVPKRLVDCKAGLFCCPPPFEIAGFTKLLVWHERTHHSPAHRWLRALLYDVITAR